jgi:hypothetical protein
LRGVERVEVIADPDGELFELLRPKRVPGVAAWLSPSVATARLVFSACGLVAEFETVADRHRRARSNRDSNSASPARGPSRDRPRQPVLQRSSKRRRTEGLCRSCTRASLGPGWPGFCRNGYPKHEFHSKRLRGPDPPLGRRGDKSLPPRSLGEISKLGADLGILGIISSKSARP